jgi:hypothetical protein
MDHSSTDHHSTRTALPDLFIYVYDHFMPSLMHEGLIEMVRKRPAKAQLSPNDLTEVTPTEFRADQVVALRKANDAAAFAVGDPGVVLSPIALGPKQPAWRRS